MFQIGRRLNSSLAPIKYEQAINLKTAKTLDIDVPPRRRGDRIRRGEEITNGR
jgi:hypothetical protein